MLTQKSITMHKKSQFPRLKKGGESGCVNLDALRVNYTKLSW